jgi:methionine-rich copper-binding protein CopC
MAMRTVGRPRAATAIVIALACCIALALPGIAAAHSYLLSSNPADGAELSKPPKRVLLTFSDPLIASGAALAVSGPDGGGRLAAAVSGPRLTAQWPADWPSGRYRVNYRVVSEDGHVMNGALSFRIAGGAAGETGQAPEQSSTAAPQAVVTGEDSTAPAAVPPWVWALGGVAVLAALAVLYATRGRR